MWGPLRQMIAVRGKLNLLMLLLPTTVTAVACCLAMSHGRRLEKNEGKIISEEIGCRMPFIVFQQFDLTSKLWIDLFILIPWVGNIFMF